MFRPDSLRRSTKVSNGVDAGGTGYAAGAEQRKSDSGLCFKSYAGDDAGGTGVGQIPIAEQSFIIAKFKKGALFLLVLNSQRHKLACVNGTVLLTLPGLLWVLLPVLFLTCRLTTSCSPSFSQGRVGGCRLLCLKQMILDASRLSYPPGSIKDFYSYRVSIFIIINNYPRLILIAFSYRPVIENNGQGICMRIISYFQLVSLQY